MSRLRTLLALLAGALVLPGLTPLAPATASLEEGKYLVTTTVTKPGPEGEAAAVDVHVYRENGNWMMSERFVEGRVRLALPAGQYRLGFDPVEPDLASEYYDDKQSLAEATFINVPEESELSPVELKRPAAITGRVLLATGQPVAGASVSAYATSNRSDRSSTAYTKTDGTFFLQPPAGDWKLQIQHHDIAREWFDDALTFNTATTIELRSANVSVGDVIVAPGRSIVGRLVSSTGTPLERILVSAVADGEEIEHDFTNTDGRFVVPDLKPGSYRLRFADMHGEFETSWYGGTSYYDAEQIELLPDQDFNVSEHALSRDEATTPPGVDLTGVVRDRAGRALLNVGVHAYVEYPDGSFGWGGVAFTDRSGRYHFTNLDRADPQKYRLEARPPWPAEQEDLGHLGAWYGGSARDNAASVPVTPGELTQGIDFTLDRAAGISGRVIDEEGNVERWTAVDVFDEHGDEVASTEADSSGRYALSMLEPGVPYFVRFSPDGVAEWHADASTMEEARAVVPRGGAWTTIDAVVADRLRPVSPPKVTGQPLVGQRLTVSPGRWNASLLTAFDYQWRRGSTVVGRGTSYIPTTADLGKRLTVLLSASNPWYPSGSTTVTTAPIRHPSTTLLTGRAGNRGKVTLTVTVASKAAPTGTVTIHEGTRLLRTVTLRAGKATLTLHKQKKGTRRYVATYAGSTTVAPSVATTTVRVRR